MIIRDGTEADLQSCTDVWVSTQSGLEDAAIPYQPLSAHELATGRLLVAEAGGEVIGFGGTSSRSGVLYLVDLFVRPAHQSGGVGRQLLHALCADHHGPLFTFASSDPRALRLYEQFGMNAVEQYYYLDARTEALVPWPTDVDLVVAQRAEILAVDAEVTRRDRTADIDYATDLGAQWYLARRHQRDLGAVAIVAPMSSNPWHPCSARLGPVMAHDPADVAPIISAALWVVAGSKADHDFVSTFVPASLAALPAMLAAGFEVVDTDLFMSSDPALIDRQRYLPTVDTP
jgi:GNAT superfamily N-acetyltransferase